MNETILAHIRRMFDVPVMQNNLRGLWAEVMICELLGREWQHAGTDWAAWDLERSDGIRIEVKQSARDQSWGKSTSAPRFSIASAKGHYPDGKRYIENTSGSRLADIYIFAWHEGVDQRQISEWMFYVVDERWLPAGQKSIGLAGIQKLAGAVAAHELCDEVEKVALQIVILASQRTVPVCY
ncbi:hypothetical protein [Puniceibacterium confluentis]|uniref:hypothetical protein n=1 Tax=Puniceibacterium confluentis TaxID=1958944 RepID=UPI0011B60290|nr:hypothetical protein [Puniceibacterium confluentis]